MLYNQELKAYRLGNSNSNPFSTYKQEENPIITFKGRITRKTVTSIDGVNKIPIGTFRLYCDISTDLINGDRIQDEYGDNYLIGFIYRPNHHHIEADLELVRKDI